ncbi:MAG: hypothetical protein WAL45_12805 [Terracidiphilus sp.]
MKMPGNRRIIQVVPRMTPALCGVSDGALLLAGELETGFGIQTAIAVLNASQTHDVPFPILYGSPAQLLETCLALTEGRPGYLLVHLSGYGYSSDGAPTLLAEALRSVRASGLFRIAVFFHELFATGVPWRSAFWHARRQKRAVRGIAEACDLLVTNTHSYVDWLHRETVPQFASPIQYMPVFSQVGEAQQRISLDDRDSVMAVFGLGGTRQNAYRELPALGDLLHQLGIQEIVDIGPEFEAPGEVGGIPVRRMGVLPAADVARQLSRSSFGFLSYPRTRLAKSGVFAGYCAHGVIPVIARHFPGQVDGLEDGVHVLSSHTSTAAQASGLESRSIAAWRWYAGHSLHDHAALYARWMDESTDEMETAPQGASREK